MNKKSIYKSIAGEKAIMSFYDSFLHCWPVPHETINIQTRHGQTFVIASGEKSAPPLILLHGSSSNSAMWMGDINEYSRNYRVYAVDIIGEPGKSSANRPDLDSSAYAEWLEDILKAVNLKKATVMGISLGGWMALNFAKSMPQYVDKLVLLCPSGIASPKLSFPLKVIPLMLLGQLGIKRISRIVCGNTTITKDVEKLTGLMAKYYKPRFKIPIFSDAELKRLTMPVLLIAGKLDALLPSDKTADRLSQLVPVLETNIIEDAGHLLVGYTDEVISFLQGY